jgi:ATP-dependent protease ClpP protease subunit
MKFNWNGEVGFEITTQTVNNDLAQAAGGPVEVELNTFGGDFFHGISIHTALKNYTGPKTVTLGAVVASAGTVIALGFDKIIARDNSTIMIHNAQSWEFGDQNDLRKLADQLEAWSKMIADMLVEKTGKSEVEIKKMLDDETWMFGQEIVDFGFADEIIKSGEATNRALALASARNKIKNSARPNQKLDPEAAIISGAVDTDSPWRYTENDKLDKLGEYPYAKNGVVFRSALRSIAARATDPAIKNRATELVKMIDRKETRVTKQEILDAAKNAVENNQLTLKEIANHLGLSAQLVGEVQNKVNEELAATKAELITVKNSLKEFDADRVKNVLAKKYSGALLTLATDMIGSAPFADIEAKMVEFEKTESAKKVAAAMADVTSPLNRIDSREQTKQADPLANLRV